MRPEPLSTLLGLAPRLPGTWHPSAANIAMEAVIVRAADIEWQVHVHAYAVRMLLTNPRGVEVTVGATIETDQFPKSRSARARASEWQAGVAVRFADLGYEGAWGPSPDGPYAHFSKKVRGVGAVPAAVRELQRIRF
jgi:hypothetical protein